MAYKIKTCENPKCGKQFEDKWFYSRFCCRSCSTQKNSTGRKRTEEAKAKTSLALKKFNAENPRGNRDLKDHSKKVGQTTKGKFNPNPESILDLSSRTISKLFKRMAIGCSRCGWNEASCDIHHIGGKKIENPNRHDNLAYLCPNCHRLYHCKKIGVSDIVTLEKYIGEKWREFYFG